MIARRRLFLTPLRIKGEMWFVEDKEPKTLRCVKTLTQTFCPIFNTLVLVPIYMYFVYSSVSIYRTFTRFIGQYFAWVAVSTKLNVHVTCMLQQFFVGLQTILTPFVISICTPFFLSVSGENTRIVSLNFMRCMLLMLSWAQEMER